jgi:hypothetical protein
LEKVYNHTNNSFEKMLKRKIEDAVPAGFGT